MPDKKIGDIQVLRAIAIILVLLQHLSVTPPIFNAFPKHGAMPFWAGVELFFVISGLVVTQSIFGRELKPFQFFIRRLFRLWPAIIFFIVLNALVLSLARHVSPTSWGGQNLVVSAGQFIFEAAATVGGFYINVPTQIYTNGAIWSLAVEFQFYLAYSVWIAICAIGINTNAYRLTLALAAILFACCLISRISLFYNLNILNFFPINYMIQWRFDFMLVGVLISGMTLSSRVAGPTLAVLAMAGALVIVAACEPDLDAGAKPFLNAIGYPALALAFGAVCLLGKSNNAFHGQDTWLYSICCWIGDRSYSIYLLHFPVLALQWLFFYRFIPSAFGGPIRYGICQAAFVIPVTILLADVSFRWVEKPGQALGKKVINSWRTRQHPIEQTA